MKAVYAPFLDRLRSPARILDAGCGCGRDTKAFTERGFAVVGIDASAALAARARAFTGRPCVVTTFQRLRCRHAFDGIWACASLVHVPKHEMPTVLQRFAQALKPGGVLYASLKHGNGEGTDTDGRFFNNYTADTFREAAAAADFREVALWLTNDLRSPGRGRHWLNALFEKPRLSADPNSATGILRPLQ